MKQNQKSYKKFTNYPAYIADFKASIRIKTSVYQCLGGPMKYIILFSLFFHFSTFSFTRVQEVKNAIDIVLEKMKQLKLNESPLYSGIYLKLISAQPEIKFTDNKGTEVSYSHNKNRITVGKQYWDNLKIDAKIFIATQQYLGLLGYESLNQIVSLVQKIQNSEEYKNDTKNFISKLTGNHSAEETPLAADLEEESYDGNIHPRIGLGGGVLSNFNGVYLPALSIQFDQKHLIDADDNNVVFDYNVSACMAINKNKVSMQGVDFQFNVGKNGGFAAQFHSAYSKNYQYNDIEMGLRLGYQSTSLDDTRVMSFLVNLNLGEVIVIPGAPTRYAFGLDAEASLELVKNYLSLKLNVDSDYTVLSKSEYHTNDQYPEHVYGNDGPTRKNSGIAMSCDFAMDIKPSRKVGIILSPYFKYSNINIKDTQFNLANADETQIVSENFAGLKQSNINFGVMLRYKFGKKSR